MLKALKELNGNTAEEMGKMAADILDKGLRQHILSEIGEEKRSVTTPSFIRAMESDISIGLGDEEPDQPAGVTEDMLEHDLDVDNPDTEAKAEAASTESYLFGNEYLDPRAAKRKKNIKTRAKVTPYAGGENEDSMSGM